MAKSEFAGKTALVTGGAGGLGRAICEAFLEAGANIVSCDINASLISDFESKVSSAHSGKTLMLNLDITQESNIQALFTRGTEQFGAVDFVINSAGRIDKFDPVGDMDKAIWDAVISLNLTTPALICKAAVNEWLKAEKKGAIVNIGSIASFRGFTCGAAYTASKHGILGLTKNTAHFYQSRGIRCNLIQPGGMQTNIANTLMQGVNMDGMAAMRVTFPESADIQVDTAKVAKLVMFLCSDAGSIMNGAALTADGGATAN